MHAPGRRCSAMSPPLLTAARSMRGSSKAPSSSSATLPATAAIAVMKRPPSPYGRQAATMRRATAPRGASAAASARERSARSSGSSPTSSSSTVGETRPGVLDRIGRPRPRIAVGRDDAIDRPVLEVPEARAEPALPLRRRASSSLMAFPRTAHAAMARPPRRRRRASRRRRAPRRGSGRGPCGRRGRGSRRCAS